MLQCLQRVLLFEREMQPRFEPGAAMQRGVSDQDLAARAPGDAPPPDSKFAFLAKDGKAVKGQRVGDPTVLPIVGVISGVFDPFMTPYIDLERRNMEELMQKSVAEDTVDR
jgi:hypothetical protein